MNQNQEPENVNKINCKDSKELFAKAAEKEKQGYSITKIYNQPRKGIFAFLFNPKKITK